MAWRLLVKCSACSVALTLLCAAGCTEEGDTFILGGGGGGTLNTDYPSVSLSSAVHNHASDRRAFTEPGHDVDDARAFSNGRDPGTGIAAVTTEEGTNLFVSYYDGTSFTPPVEIVGQNQDDGAAVDLDTMSVVFLNDVDERDGDAVLLFRRRETGTTLDTDGDNIYEDDNNVRLYSFYFDVSQSQNAVSTAQDGSELLYGFSTLATFVDSDPNGDSEDRDTDVQSFGLVSDGLCFSSEFNTFNNQHRSGDAASFVYAVWTQEPPTTNASTDVGLRVWYSQFELSSTSTRFPPPGGTLDAPDGIGLEEEDDAGTQLIAHNGLLIWTLDTDNSDPTDNDDYLLATVFDLSSPRTTELLSRSDPDTADVVRTSARQARNLYGDDHDLPRFWFFYQEEGFDGGNASSELDLMVAAVDLDGSDSELEEIDEFVDGTGPDVAPVVPGSMATAMSRGGGAILVSWRQDHLSSQEALGVNVSPTPSLFVRGVDTGVTSSIADALTGDVQQNHTATRMNADVHDTSGVEVGRGVLNHAVQQALADGTTSPDAALQSNRFRVHWIFEQELIDISGSSNVSSDRVALHVAYVEFDTSMPMPTFTSGSGTASDEIVDTVDQNWDSLNGDPLLQVWNGRGAAAVDDGDGDVIVFYLNQGNNPDDAFAPGSGGAPVTVPAVELEIPLSASGAPSFQVGEVIELSRITNAVVVTNEPNCTYDHVHSETHPMYGRVIFIDGQGPYPEPSARQSTCGIGRVVQLTVTPPDELAAFSESRLFFWRDGQSLEISSDGSDFGSTGSGSPDFFQVEDFKLVTTPIDTDVVNRPDFGGDTVQVVIREHNSNRGSFPTGNGFSGSPLVLRARTYHKTDPDPDPANRFDPPLDQPPERVDTGQPSHVDDVVFHRDGDTLALYFLSNDRLYYNEYSPGRGWLTDSGLPDPALVDDDSARPVESFLVGDPRLCTGDSTLAGVPVFWTKRNPDAQSPRRLRARIHR